MPPKYEHVNAEGAVTESVQPAEDSKNAAQLAAKAKNPDSGWRVAKDDTADATEGAADTPPGEVRRGRGSARVDVSAGGES